MESLSASILQEAYRDFFRTTLAAYAKKHRVKATSPVLP